jgi:Flp pilus assembly protein TadB
MHFKKYPGAGVPVTPTMRVLGLCVAVAAVVFLVTGGRVLFLPLVILPLGLLSFGRRRTHHRQRRGF